MYILKPTILRVYTGHCSFNGTNLIAREDT